MNHHHLLQVLNKYKSRIGQFDTEMQQKTQTFQIHLNTLTFLEIYVLISH